MRERSKKVSTDDVTAKKRHVIIPASYLVLRKGNQVLLSKRHQTGYADGKYSMIAGHVDQGESFTQAILRECVEEANITILPEDIKVAHVMHRKASDSERVDVFFLVEKWMGEITNQEPHKCSDLSWFSVDRLPENILPFVQKAISYIDQKVFYSESGWDSEPQN